MHITTLQYSVLIKFVPLLLKPTCRFIAIERDAIAVSNGIHVAIIMLCPVVIVNYSNATVSIIYNCRPHMYEYNIVAIIAMILHVLLQYNRSVVSISPNPITYHNKQFP